MLDHLTKGDQLGRKGRLLVSRPVRLAVAAAVTTLVFAAQAQSALAQPADGVPGAAVFTQTCAACHLPTAASGGMERAPKLETIKTFPPERIVDALTTGKMKAQGAALSDAQRRDVAEWIAGRKIGPESAASAMPDRCVGATAMKGLGGWNGWSPDRSNSRFQTASVAGIKAAEVPHLKLKWAFAFPGGAQVNSQPSVVGGWLFIGSDSGTIYALDAKTGCLHWTSKAGAAVRTAPVVAPLDGAKGPPTVFVGDLAGKLYAMDAANGRIVWSTQLDEMPQIRVMDAPAVYGGRLYVGVSSGEEGALGIAGYECCRFRGSVSALDSATGRILWKTYTVAEPKLTVDSAGVRRWGPAGGGSWSTPTIDVKRKLVYVTTGNAYAAPAGPLNDSVVALDLATGKVVWNHQETANDAWLFGCKDGMTGCPAKVGPDWDFSSSPMLKTLPDGRQLIVAANKGGVALGLDPDHAGAVVWRTTLYAKPPTFYGDVLFGGASDGSKAYYALQETNAVTAIRLKDGVKVWSHPFTPVAGRAERTGFGAALTAIPGVLFNGGWDGVLHALSASDGRQLWSFDTARPFKTVNGVEGKGGSMGGPGPTVAGGMLYVGSGYVGVSNGMAGNVLLAFAP